MTATSAGEGGGALDAGRQWAGEQLGKVEARLGGAARTRAIALLACVLGLDSADKGATGALAPQLEAALHINNFQVGLLVAVSSLVGAGATLPFGVLADRTRRNRILMIGVLVWALAEAASGAATSYLMLLFIRLALGVVAAISGPFVASLTGDLFPTRERSQVYGFILTGELLGAGLGLVVSGDLGSALNWRVGYAVLAVPSLAVAWALHRWLPEPARGGQSWLQAGDEEIVSAEEVARHPEEHPEASEAEGAGHDDPVREQVREEAIAPDPAAVLHGDARQMGMLATLRWVLKVRTNVILIVASSLGYFFFGGLRTFAVLFVRGRYGVSESGSTGLIVLVGVAAIGGILVFGRLGDRWVRRGRLDARMVTGAAGYLLAAAVFVPGLLTSSLAIALPFFLLAAFLVAAPNPPVDAARLDVVPSRMWGRAEAIRTFVRTLLEAFAPLLFGWVSLQFGGSTATSGFAAGVGSAHVHISRAASHGLDLAFLVMLVPLALSGVLLLLGRRRYSVDVASAARSEEAATE